MPSVTNQVRNFGRKRSIKRKPRVSYKKKYRITRNSRPSKIKLPIILADEIRVKLKYSERVAMLSTAGALATYEFNGNSMYDPNAIGTGQQPVGFDEWTAFYDQYTVTGSKIKVTFANIASTNPAAACEVVLLATQSNAFASAIESAGANPNSKSRLYAIQSGFPTLTMYMSTAKALGESPQAILLEGSYSGLMGNVGTGSSPVAMWSWQLYSQPVDQSTTTTNYAFVEITYYARLNLRKLLVLS